jgi:hypothetical protein
VTLDQRADHLASIGAQLAARIRDDEPPVVHQWLREQLPDPADWFALCFVLAPAVPVDRPWTELTRWCWAPINPRWRRESGASLKPHGTVAALRRHRYHGDKPCEPCLAAERTRDRERKAARRRAEVQAA